MVLGVIKTYVVVICRHLHTYKRHKIRAGRLDDIVKAVAVLTQLLPDPVPLQHDELSAL